MLRLLQSAALPLGMVRVSQPGHVTALDSGVLPFDYTVYTAVCCAETGRYYWTTYENQRVRYVTLGDLGPEAKQFPLDWAPDFQCLSGRA